MKENKEQHKRALSLIKKEIKRHSFGNLEAVFLVGTRPWGFSRENVDHDYRVIYSLKNANAYNVYINGYNEDITMISAERLIHSLFVGGNIHELIVVNSPAVYMSEIFKEFKNFINKNITKGVYYSASSIKRDYIDRKDYLYGFLFMGNGILALQGKKIQTNLKGLARELKVSGLKKLIKEEQEEGGFSKNTENLFKKELSKIKDRLDLAYKKSKLEDSFDFEKLKRLKIFKRVNYKYWEQEYRFKLFSHNPDKIYK